MRDREENETSYSSETESFWSRHKRAIISGAVVLGSAAAGTAGGYLMDKYCPYVKFLGLVANLAIGFGTGTVASGIPVSIANIIIACNRRNEYEHIYDVPVLKEKKNSCC